MSKIKMSPEEYLLAEIKKTYAKTYPNIIMTLTNKLEAKDKKIVRLRRAFQELYNPLEYLSLELNLLDSGMTIHQWAGGILNGNLRLENGKMFVE